MSDLIVADRVRAALTDFEQTSTELAALLGLSVKVVNSTLHSMA